MTELHYKQVIVLVKEVSGVKRVITFLGQGITSCYVELRKDDKTNLVDGGYYTVDIDLVDSSLAKATGFLTLIIGQPELEQIEKNKILFDEVTKSFEKAQFIAQNLVNSNIKEKNSIPDIPKNLYIKEDTWNLICGSLLMDMYPLLLGPKGVGKTEVARSLATAFDAEYYPFNIGMATKPKQFFVGMVMAKENASGNVETTLIKSEFLKAFTSEKKTYIFLDEFTRIPQQAETYLMTVLDRSQSYIYVEELGERVYRGKDVHFLAAGNIGKQYTGTRTIDGAFWDRFVKHTMSYLTLEEELKLVLEKAPNCPVKPLTTLIKRAQITRNAEEAGKLDSAISPRQVIDMARFLEFGFSLDLITQTVFLNNFLNGTVNDIDEIKGMIQSI